MGRKFLLSLSITLFVFFTATLLSASSARADGVPMDITISASGPGLPGEQLADVFTGSFVFHPTTVTISNFNVSGTNLLAQDGSHYFESFSISSVAGTALGGTPATDLFTITVTGSAGDSWSWGLRMSADGSGGFIPSESGRFNGTGMGIKVDNMTGTATPDPVPEPPALFLCTVGLIGLAVLARKASG